VLSDYHFCPTALTKRNLLKEGIDAGKIFVVGNTILDTLRIITSSSRLKLNIPSLKYKDLSKRIILITLHRRESWGEKTKTICYALKELAKIFKNDLFMFPIHPNPKIRNIIEKIFKDIDNFIILPALDYKNFILLMKSSYVVLTDSGGIQEEAPSLNKPVLILRDKTERPEIIKIGAGKIISTNYQKIINETEVILSSSLLYKKMIHKKNPYGDGFAAKKIVRILKKIIC
jgi:UDP-N-acetylglucosamine 2-epimerase (non-hydrolysing)